MLRFFAVLMQSKLPVVSVPRHVFMGICSQWTMSAE